LKVGEALLEFRKFHHEDLSRMIHKTPHSAGRIATILLASDTMSRYDFSTHDKTDRDSHVRGVAI